MAHQAQQSAALLSLGVVIWAVALRGGQSHCNALALCSRAEMRLLLAQRKHSTALLTMRLPLTPLYLCLFTYTHTDHKILWNCQTLKAGEAVGTGNGEEPLK